MPSRMPGWPRARRAASRSSSCWRTSDLSYVNRLLLMPPLIRFDPFLETPLAAKSILVEMPAMSMSPLLIPGPRCCPPLYDMADAGPGRRARLKKRGAQPRPRRRGRTPAACCCRTPTNSNRPTDRISSIYFYNATIRFKRQAQNPPHELLAGALFNNVAGGYVSDLIDGPACACAAAAVGGAAVLGA